MRRWHRKLLSGRCFEVGNMHRLVLIETPFVPLGGLKTDGAAEGQRGDLQFRSGRKEVAGH